MTDSIINTLREMGCEVEPCGSRVTCDPVPESADYDFLVLAPGFLLPGRAHKKIMAAGFTREGDTAYSVSHSIFASYRLHHSGEVETNLIVTSDATFAKNHRLATYICKTLNILDKPKRVAVFQAALYGKMP